MVLNTCTNPCPLMGSFHKVILKEGWTFIGVHRVNHTYLIKTKLIIDQPIDVTSHPYGWSNDSL